MNRIFHSAKPECGHQALIVFILDICPIQQYYFDLTYPILSIHKQDMNSSIHELIDDFALFSDWEERYAYLIDLGKKLIPMDESFKNENTLVPGCVSKVWMVLEEQDGQIHFIADSDAHIVRGLIGILARIYNGRTRAEISDIDMEEVFRQLGLDGHITPNRRNGFFAMVKKIEAFAK
jgi:cysteine desulfuration protein SufE